MPVRVGSSEGLGVTLRQVLNDWLVLRDDVICQVERGSNLRTCHGLLA